MAFINLSKRTGTIEQVVGRHEDGSILQGEYDIYKRIQKDCENSNLHWYVWYDLLLPISYQTQSEIQIDFLLICEKGAIILEVKGGSIEVIKGHYYYSNKYGDLTPMKDSPFDQANRYRWALINHNVLNSDQLFVDYAVAFPHKEMIKTNLNDELDQSPRLWDRSLHDDEEESIADFFESILDNARKTSTKSKFVSVLTEDGLQKVVSTLAPTFEDKGRYSQSSLNEVLNWLHIENLDILDGLSLNRRIMIEGGPGTGKTTLAKAYIKKHKGLKGLYLCHNILLAKRIECDLVEEDLYNCEVYTYGKFLFSLGVEEDKIMKISSPLLREFFSHASHNTYDYIIIDEAQDIIDKGIEVIIDEFTSNLGNGLETGSYLVFYDIEQGFNSNYRRLEKIVDDLLKYAVHFKLNENKRIITNRKLVEIANTILQLDSEESYHDFVKKISEKDISYLTIQLTDSNKTLSKAFREAVKNSEDHDRTIVLAHSNFRHLPSPEDNTMTLYDSLSCKPGIHILDENDIANPDHSTNPFTTILKYKGLETNKVILVLPYNVIAGDIKNFLYEIYVGFTRAMMELHVIIFNKK